MCTNLANYVAPLWFNHHFSYAVLEMGTPSPPDPPRCGEVLVWQISQPEPPEAIISPRKTGYFTTKHAPEFIGCLWNIRKGTFMEISWDIRATFIWIEYDSGFFVPDLIRDMLGKNMARHGATLLGLYPWLGWDCCWLLLIWDEISWGFTLW